MGPTQSYVRANGKHKYYLSLCEQHQRQTAMVFLEEDNMHPYQQHHNKLHLDRTCQ
ncbi:hypothetical protein Scep_006433 [Stephania cephalantha]|uniref:Uncharacterized protein n=1 Tax=Stephania cephalantha TaxID=152367 RepID=A0AAP0K820_9MAGN